MRKSLPLVTGFSKILNSKIKKSEINNKKINQKNINENIKLKYSINDKNKMNNKKKNKGFIYNFCQNLIKNNCMTFNSEIDINSEDSKVIDYLKFLTFLSVDEIKELEKKNQEHPEYREAHKQTGQALTPGSARSAY